MRSGLLRHRIDIETQPQTADAYGDIVEPYTAVYSGVPASVIPLRGVQLEQASATANSVSHKVSLRYLSGIAPSQRVKFGSRYFDIESVINIRELNRDLELMCIEQV